MTQQIKFFHKNKFAKAILSQNIKIYVLCISSFIKKILTYLAKIAFIILLFVEKITILIK